MSKILHRREINVAITAEEAGKEFADAASDVQAAFLTGWLDATMRDPGFGWTMQCNYIAAEFSGEKRVQLFVLLSTLLEHLED